MACRDSLRVIRGQLGIDFGGDLKLTIQDKGGFTYYLAMHERSVEISETRFNTISNTGYVPYILHAAKNIFRSW